MSVRLPAFLLAVATFVTPSLASADPIAIVSLPIDFGAGISPQLPISKAGFEVTIHGSVHLFRNVPITEATVGQTLIANASTDSQFSAFAAFATNGIPNITHFDFVTPGGIGSIGADSEAALFRLPAPAVDFHGFTLSSVQLQVNDFSLTTINGAPFRFLHGQLSVFGEGASQTVTPEPASVMLLSIGGIALVVRRRRPQHG
jgi:PEP-CTERM motif